MEKTDNLDNDYTNHSNLKDYKDYRYPNIYKNRDERRNTVGFIYNNEIDDNNNNFEFENLYESHIIKKSKTNVYLEKIPKKIIIKNSNYMPSTPKPIYIHIDINDIRNAEISNKNLIL